MKRMNKQLRKNKINPHELMFFLCYTGVFAYFLFQAVPFLVDPLWIIYKISMVLLIPTSILSIRQLPKKSIFWIAIIAVLILINRTITDSDDFIILFLLVVSAKGIKFSKIVKYDLCMKIPALIILPIMYFSGGTAVYDHVRGDIIRHSMGFYNPNFFSSYVMSVIMEILYLRRNKLGPIDIITTIISCLIIDYFADSRTQMLSVAAMCIFLFIIQGKKTAQLKNRFIKFCIYNSAAILSLLSLGLTLVYAQAPSSYSELNHLTSGRLSNSKKALSSYGTSILGNKESSLANLKNKDVVLDNVYIYIFSVHGTLTLLIWCTLMRNYIKYADTKHQIILVFIMLCFIISGLAERTCMRPRYDVFLLYFAYMLYGNPEKDSTKLESKNPEE